MNHQPSLYQRANPNQRVVETVEQVAADLENAIPGIKGWQQKIGYVRRNANIYGLEANGLNAEQFGFLQTLLLEAESFTEGTGSFDSEGQLQSTCLTLYFNEKYARDLSRELRLFLQALRGNSINDARFSFFVIEANNTELRVADARRYSGALISKVEVAPLERADVLDPTPPAKIAVTIEAFKVEADAATIRDAQEILNEIDRKLNPADQRQVRWDQLAGQIGGNTIPELKEAKPAIKKPVASKKKPATKVATKKTPVKKTSAKKTTATKAKK